MKVINRFEEVFIGLGLFIAACFIFIEVVLRAFGSSISWSQELVRYLIIWITLIGSSVCIRNGAHVSIDILSELIKGKIKKGLALFIYLIAIFFSVLFTYYSMKYLVFSFSGNQITPALGIPIYIVYISLPLSGLLMILRYVQRIFQMFQQSVKHS